ncbi:MAG: sugar kinase [Pleurocapsa minor GSE-CHR-MK-17-07R]|jgi:2-dehydro-3-deoxygluconokinase|nr:sugar kinase [Pleurocapsa minor GSE-CHR-MK 17-07R]
MPTWDVTSFGESMLRLSVPAGERLEAADSLRVETAGAESNVCAALAQLGWKTAWASRVPDNPLGRRIVNSLRELGVDTSLVAHVPGERLGLNFVEFSVPPRPTEVIYDRANSSAAAMSPDQLPWPDLLNTRLLHLTGITAALSESAFACVAEARKRAAEAGVPVSFDINYRSRLWSVESARDGLLRLAQQADMLFCKLDDAQLLFGVAGDHKQIVRRLAGLFGVPMVVMTCGAHGVYGLQGDEVEHVPARKVTILDRIGAGDAMSAGVLHGWLKGNFALGLRAGTTLAALALSQHGDMVRTHPAEFEALLDMSDTMIRR